MVDLPGAYSLMAHSAEEELAGILSALEERRPSLWSVTPPASSGI